MAKVFMLSLALTLAGSTFALAQSDTGAASSETSGRSAGIRSGNITSTGETVPNPGVSQGAGTTPLDRGIQREDDRIQSGICKGC